MRRLIGSLVCWGLVVAWSWGPAATAIAIDEAASAPAVEAVAELQAAPEEA